LPARRREIEAGVQSIREPRCTPVGNPERHARTGGPEGGDPP